MLNAYSATDLKRLDRQERHRQRRQQQDRALADADAERADFVLTGSDRPADELAARGQQRLFE